MGADSKENRIELAKRIKKARKDAGFTQAQVAKELGLTPQAISCTPLKICKGKNKGKTPAQIA